MVGEINAQWAAHPEYDNRLLIEGIGLQSHHNDKHFSPQNVRAALARFAETGARLAITELDFTYGSSESPAEILTDEQAAAQAEHYRTLFNLYREFEQVERVTFWAKCDGQSWRKWGAPVLFDAQGAAKKAFYAIQ
jgi:endo-1,4-beta-xylanase